MPRPEARIDASPEVQKLRRRFVLADPGCCIVSSITGEDSHAVPRPEIPTLMQQPDRSAVQPLFGDAASAQRLIEGAPKPAGLGGGGFQSEFEVPTRVFSEAEMKVIRAVTLLSPALSCIPPSHA